MEQKKLLQIDFESYLGLCTSIFIAFGLAFGILMFLISAIGGGATADLFFFQLSGAAAGISGLIIAPLMLAFTGLIFGAISYIPFKFYLKIKKGVIINGEWEEKIGDKQAQETAEPSLRNLDKQNDLAGQI